MQMEAFPLRSNVYVVTERWLYMENGTISIFSMEIFLNSFWGCYTELTAWNRMVQQLDATLCTVKWQLL